MMMVKPSRRAHLWSAVVMTALLSWPGAAAATPLRAQMARCELWPEYDVPTQSFGNVAERRKLWMH